MTIFFFHVDRYTDTRVDDLNKPVGYKYPTEDTRLMTFLM